MGDIKNVEMESPKPKSKFYCTYCNVGFNRQTHYDTHLKTKKHIRNEKKPISSPNVSDQYVEKSNAKLKQYMEEIITLKNKLSLTEKDNANNEQRLQDKMSKIEALQQSILNLNKQVEKLSEVKNNVCESCVQLRSQIDQTQTSLTGQIDMLNKKNSTLEANYEAYMKSYDQMRELFDTMTPKINELSLVKHNNQLLQKQVDDFNNNASQHTQSLLQDENIKLKKIIKACGNIDQVRSQNKDLNDEVIRLKIYIKQFGNIEGIIEQNKTLKNENSEMKRIVKEFGDSAVIQKKSKVFELENTALKAKYKELMLKSRIQENMLRELEYKRKQSSKSSLSYDSDDGWN